MTQLICGLLKLDGDPPDQSLVRRMAMAMQAPGANHRISVASQGPVAMAAVRIGVSGASLDAPALVEREGSVLAGDVSIFDRSRARLSGQGGSTDGAFLYALLSTRGDSALGDLHGDFAFAFWRENRLILGRDHFGARPLVFTERPGQYLAFASSPAALLRTGLASTDLDEAVAASWVLQPAPPPGRTIYRDIRPVDAAHLVVCEAGPATARRYWRLQVPEPLPFDSDPRALAAETARLLTQAVERRLPVAGAVAGHLSGGLDSSPIAVLAARAQARAGQKFFGYTFREPFDGPGRHGTGDAPVADLVAAAEPAITQVSIVSPSLLAELGKGIEPETMLPISADEPEEQVLRHAAEQGVDRILTGWGGDQIVSFQGRGAQVELFRAGRFLQLWQYLLAESRGTGIGLARLFFSTVVMQGLPQGFRERLRRLFGREASFLISMGIQSRLVAAHRRDSLLIETWPDDGDSHRMRRDSVEAWYIQTRLETFARQGARHGIAYAYPLLDLDLVEFSLRVPGMFLRQGGQRRVLFRQALEGILPDEVRLNPVKLRPFPGDAERSAAGRDHLLALLDQWGKNARIRDYLDLEFMAETIRSSGDPAAPQHLADADASFAFQIAGLLSALEQDRAPQDEPVAGAQP